MFKRLGSAVFKTQQNLWMRRTKTYCTATITDTEIDAKVLNVINTKNVKELQIYGVSQGNAKKIVNRRAEHGPYTSVEDMLFIKGFTTKHLKILVTSIFENEHAKYDQDLIQNRMLNLIRKGEEHKLISNKGVHWITPKLPSKMTHVNKLLGLHFSEGIVSWALLNRDYEILDWNYDSLPNEGSDRCNYESMTKTVEFIDRLPNSDIYIVEENGQSRTRRKQLHYGHQQAASYVMASLAIKSGTFSLSKNNMFVLKAKSSAQFFNLIVGSETVSTDYVMPMLLYGGDNKLNNQNVLPPIRMQSTIQKLYEQKKTIEKELMNWSLLKTITFLHILNFIDHKKNIA